MEEKEDNKRKDGDKRCKPKQDSLNKELQPTQKDWSGWVYKQSVLPKNFEMHVTKCVHLVSVHIQFFYMFRHVWMWISWLLVFLGIYELMCLFYAETCVLVQLRILCEYVCSEYITHLFMLKYIHTEPQLTFLPCLKAQHCDILLTLAGDILPHFPQ